jgi:hypothetical protein
MNITLNTEAAAILKTIVKSTGKTEEVWLTEFINKQLKAQEKPIARQKLNIVKDTAVLMINNGSYKSLQHFYNAAGLSKEVHTFGGINTVYHEIYLKQGRILPAEKLVTEIEAVPAKVG